MFLLLTMITCDSPRQCCTHNKRTCLTPIPLYNPQSIGTLRGSIKEIDMVEIVEVCLRMFQVAVVDESTTDQVGRSDQQLDISVEREERSRTELVRARNRKRTQELCCKYPDRKQE